jgi:hypothetical protein
MSWKDTRAGQRLINMIGEDPENKRAAEHYFMYKAFKSAPLPLSRFSILGILKRLIRRITL